MAPRTTKQLDARAAALMAALNDGLPSRRRPGPSCSVGRALGEMPDALSSKMSAVIDSNTASVAAVAQLLINAGYADVSAYSVGRHRRRGSANGCRCAR